MRFLLGQMQWKIVLVDGHVYVDGQAKFGGSSLEKQEIYISLLARPGVRVATLGHELAHMIKDTCDIYESDLMSIEAACNLSGMLLTFVGMQTLCRLTRYVSLGVESDEVQSISQGSMIPVVPVDWM